MVKKTTLYFPKSDTHVEVVVRFLSETIDAKQDKLFKALYFFKE